MTPHLNRVAACHLLREAADLLMRAGRETSQERRFAAAQSLAMARARLAALEVLVPLRS